MWIAAKLAKANLVSDLEDALELYQLSVTQPMELVLFDDVLRHISTTCRVFRQGRGNMLMLGLSGCGRRSVVKLAAHVLGAELVQISLARGYGLSEFREDLKPLLTTAGVVQRPVVFFIAEGQIVEEDFLREISSILETGKVEGLFSEEEMNMFGEDLKRSRPRGAGEDTRPTEQIFADNVMQNLHVALSLAPVGERYLHWMRIYPALTNWTTCDWYRPWPETALLAVAQSHLEPKKDPLMMYRYGLTEEKEKTATLLTDVPMVCKACVAVTESVTRQLMKLPGTALVITPKFFVELLKVFKSMLVEKETRLNHDLQRLRGGLDKLFECNESVEQMQASLAMQQPELAEMAESTIVLMGQLAHDKEEADRVSSAVRRDQNKVEDMTRKCEAVQRDAEKDLADAMPAFHAAIEALNTLTKGSITEVKSFKDPPVLVKKTMEAVCILKFVEPSWKNAQKILMDFNFRKSLKEYAKDDVTDETRAALGTYINDPGFNPQAVGKVSTACRSICLWVEAIDKYAEVNSNVRPKKERLKEAQEQAAEMQAQLAEKQAELAEVMGRLQQLEENYQDSLRRRDSLDNQMHDAKIRIARAEKLTTQLGDEQERWSKMSAKLESNRGQLVGDTLLAAAFIGFAGAFDVANRKDLIQNWIKGAQDLDLPVNPSFSLEYTLGDPVELREWKLQGLPPDSFSIENSMVVAHTRRWPLLTDPQGQASTWIKNMEKNNGVQTIKANDPNLLRIVESSIRMGIPVLLENVGESIDPNLRPIYQKQTYSAGGRMAIRLGDVDIDYHPSFKLYMTCNLPNPSYTTDVYTTLTVIDFAVSRFDLEDQLLTMVVANEKPDLEEQKDKLVLDINNGEKMLSKVEEEILDMLKSSQGNILDDETLIEQLDRAKNTSNEVRSKMEDSKITEVEIEKSRGAYRSVATRGSVLYFAVATMSSLSPMYHNSLGFFRNLFTHVMKNTKKSKNLDERLTTVINALTGTVFDKVCRGLFEKDKLLFSFVITAQILIQRGEVTDQEWDFMVRGIVQSEGASAAPPAPNPCTSWLADSTWTALLALSTLPGFSDLPRAIGGGRQEAWRRFRSDPDMHTQELPARELQQGLSLFQRLLLCKTLREDTLELSVMHFVEQALGRRFIEPTNATLTGCFEDSSAFVPTIFILSPGADPTQLQLSFARSKDMEDRLDFVSLGRGQGPTAEKLIRKGCDGGRWVCLQNCHLFLQWMPHLESLVEELPALVDPGSTFRLWLTSYPAEGFPVPVIQCSVKMSNEMPRGLRANLLRTYRQMSSGSFETTPVPKRKLLFALAFLHAALLDRCTFGSIGFNNPYEWTAADLDISITVLNQELHESTMEETLTYMIGNVNYGGRVTDPWDQRCVQSLLAKFLKSGRSQIDIPFDEEGVYGCPDTCESQQECITYIQSLPIATDPSVFGLHESAEVAFRTNSSELLLHKIVTASQTHVAGKGDTRLADNELALSFCHAIEKQLANPLEITLPESTSETVDAMRIVLEQEVVRYNQLHTTMSQSLADLERAIDGRGIMTKSLDAVFTALLLQRVPLEWKETIGDVGHKSLSSWVSELGKRLENMRLWCAQGKPNSFYLPGLVFPQGLLAGITQQYGRQNDIAIDTLALHTQVTRMIDPDEIQFAMSQYDIDRFGGVYIHGLQLEGGRWDKETGALKDPMPDGESGVAGARFSEMPVLWCRPVILRDSGPPTDETPRTSTPGPSDDGASQNSGPPTFSNTWDGGGGEKSGASPKAQLPRGSDADVDSEIESITQKINPTACSRKSAGREYTPYDRTPTPLPPDTVIYPEAKQSFTCPVYKTARRGADSCGYIMSCELATATKADNWVLRGTALMCEGEVR